MRAIAVSRDLEARGLKRGVEVEIDGLDGRYTVLDRMARRWKDKIDIYMGDDVAAARTWGKRQVTIRWSVPPAASAPPPAVSSGGEREIVVAVQVPNPCWRVEITGAFRDAERLLVLSELVPPEPGMMCAQVVAVARDRAIVIAAPGSVRHLVTGRQWRSRLTDAPSDSSDEIVFLGDRAAIDEAIGDAQPVSLRRIDGPDTRAAKERDVIQ
jgi:hypothetical protein